MQAVQVAWFGMVHAPATALREPLNCRPDPARAVVELVVGFVLSEPLWHGTPRLGHSVVAESWHAADHHRAGLSNVRFVAVTGSCGKTTTVKLAHQIVSGSLRGTASPEDA